MSDERRSHKYRSLIDTRRWRELRHRMIEEHPLCEDCAKEGKLTFATEVHHVRPIQTMRNLDDMERLAYDPGNLACLCHDCHKQRHRELKSNSSEERKERERKAREDFERRFYRQ